MSSAQCDPLRDMAKIQVNVAMRVSGDTEVEEDFVADVIGWRLFHAEKSGRATVAVMRTRLGLLRHSGVRLRWAMLVLGSIIFMA